MADSNSFSLLDPRIQRYIWAEGWTELRDAQELAIPLIVEAKRDVIVAAATAAGKTEAAFLPALTHLLGSEPVDGLIVYISPLKALINDQFGRLDRLCEDLDIPVWPWHGDIAANLKAKFLKRPTGVLLITPESMEAFLCNRGTSVGAIFAGARYFVVDELHAFIGSERGKQLRSLLHRVERAIARTVPRIGLSATLGDIRLAADFLRPTKGAEVAVVESHAPAGELRILVKGYEEPAVERQPEPNDSGEDEKPETIAPAQIAAHLFKLLRGSNNLVFPNSRREVERYTHILNEMCAKAQVPNEFWPHHGSLSKELRSDTEAALKQHEHPATAICTNTLELGIDIGAVKSVAQIGPPPSVASLRQRLGRSGRRKGEPAILRGYCIENAITSKSELAAHLRLETVKMVAMISLLLEHWVEPPIASGIHLSTLVQQILSFIAQNGGATASQIFALLVAPSAPFAGLAPDDFKDLLRHLGQKGLLTQDSSGLLLHGQLGEKLVNHYSFYAAFASDEEFRIVAGGKPLGSLPVSQMMHVGQHVLFGGRTWLVEEVNSEEKTIYVVRTKGGVPPVFSGGAGRVHTRVRQRMRELMATTSDVKFVDETVQRFLRESRAAYARLSLDKLVILDQGSQVFLFTWLGDGANEVIACLLARRSMTAWTAGPGLEVMKKRNTSEDIERALYDACIDGPPSLPELLSDAKNLERAKWDWALPQSLLQKTYGSLNLNIEEAFDWLRSAFPDGATRQRPSSETGQRA
ncbi:MAG: DEAD/DEAH box helicase [Acidiferrobacter sp.]